MRLAGASATMAAVRARRRSAPTGYPAVPQLFLHVDDGLGAGQPPRQTRILLLNKSEFARQRVGLGGFRAALDRNQSAKGPGRAKPTPVAERRRVNALATQNRANPTSVGGAIGLGQDAQLVLGSERPSPRAIGEFR